MDEIQTVVRRFILENFLSETNSGDLESGTPLITGGILDSLATLRLVFFLEERFGVQVEPHEVTAENLANLERIADLVRRTRRPG